MRSNQNQPSCGETKRGQVSLCILLAVSYIQLYLLQRSTQTTAITIIFSYIKLWDILHT